MIQVSSTFKQFQVGISRKILSILSSLTHVNTEYSPDKEKGRKLDSIIYAIDMLIFSNIILWILGIVYFFSR